MLIMRPTNSGGVTTFRVEHCGKFGVGTTAMTLKGRGLRDQHDAVDGDHVAYHMAANGSAQRAHTASGR